MSATFNPDENENEYDEDGEGEYEYYEENSYDDEKEEEKMKDVDDWSLPEQSPSTVHEPKSRKSVID